MEKKFISLEWNGAAARGAAAHNPAIQQRREANHQSNQMLAFLLAPHLMDLVDSAKREEERRKQKQKRAEREEEMGSYEPEAPLAQQHNNSINFFN